MVISSPQDGNQYEKSDANETCFYCLRFASGSQEFSSEIRYHTSVNFCSSILRLPSWGWLPKNKNLTDGNFSKSEQGQTKQSKTYFSSNLVGVDGVEHLITVVSETFTVADNPYIFWCWFFKWSSPFDFLYEFWAE